MTALEPSALEHVTLPRLWRAAHEVARGKRNRAGMARFRLDLEGNLVSLRQALLAGTWRPSPPRTLTIHDGKTRVITVPSIRDRIVHHLVGEVLEPIHERRLIPDTYACRREKGTHAALARMRAWSRTYRWVVHLDVEKYFPSLDHAIVRDQLRRDLGDCWMLEWCDRILDAGGGDAIRRHMPGDDLFTPQSRRTGLPLGSLTSQLWANRYLDPVDHLVKDRLRVRPYLRYMDDMMLFGHDRAELLALARRVEEACHDLRLRLHPWDVMPTRDGVGFVGYRVKPDHVRVRRSSVARAERRMGQLADEVRHGRATHDELWSSLRATFGHFDHADSWRLKERFLRRIGLLHE